MCCRFSPKICLVILQKSLADFFLLLSFMWLLFLLFTEYQLDPWKIFWIWMRIQETQRLRKGLVAYRDILSALSVLLMVLMKLQNLNSKLEILALRIDCWVGLYLGWIRLERF